MPPPAAASGGVSGLPAGTGGSDPRGVEALARELEVLKSFERVAA